MLQLPPKVTKVGKDKHAITFTYNFTGDNYSPINVGGYGIEGSEYQLVVGSGIAANVGAIRSIRFVQTFSTYTNVNDAPGSLFIFPSGSNDVTAISPLVASYLNDNPGIYPRVSGVIPIVCNQPSIINFVKASDDPAGMSGILMATLYDFDVAPFIQSGFSSI